MAIGAIHLDWLCRVARVNGFASNAAVLDLGPQDVQVPRAVLEVVALHRMDRGRAEAILSRIYDRDQPRRDAQAGFYSLFGASRYSSADNHDDRADFKLDLNNPPSNMDGLRGAMGRFDVITNFGTAEHVFNIGCVFMTMHDLLLPGGVVMHAMPSYGFVNHGFYTVNPNIYVEMARSNGYELLDFSYVDNMFVREVERKANPSISLDFDHLPIRLEDMQSTQSFMTKIVWRHFCNLQSEETCRVLRSLSSDSETKIYPSPDLHLCFVFDLCFVALRKPYQERAFVMPQQRMEGLVPLGSNWKRRQARSSIFARLLKWR